MKPARAGRVAAVFARAVAAGTIASISGSAIVTPIPRRNVRRGNDIFEMNIAESPVSARRLARRGDLTRGLLRGLHPHLKRRTVDNALDQRRETVVLGLGFPDDLPHDGHIL